MTAYAAHDAPHHTCDSRVPVCPCGRRWEYQTEAGDQPRYTSAAVIALYELLYGPHPNARRVEEVA